MRAELVVALAAALSASTATAQVPRTIEVGPAGDLGAALREARDGDTVVVQGGVHRGPLVI